MRRPFGERLAPLGQFTPQGSGVERKIARNEGHWKALDRTAINRHYQVMNRQTDIIELDKATADRLKERAAELGMSIGEFLAAVANETGVASVDPGEIAELDRRWAKVETGARTVRNEEVVRWLETWGTPEFKPWREQ